MFRTNKITLPVVFALALVFGLGAFGCGGDDPSGEGGDANLVGTWTGKELGDDATSWTFTFGEKTAQVVTDGVEAYSASWTSTQSSPKRLSLVITSSSYSQYIGKATRGIYKIEGTILTFAGNEPGVGAYPTSFTPGGGTRVFELTMQ